MSGGTLADIAWGRLRTERNSAELGVPSIEVPVDTGSGMARLALGDRNELRLLLPLDPGSPFPVLAETYGLELKDRMLLLRGRQVRFIDLVCRDEALDEVFQKLVSDILRRLEEGAKPAGSIEGAISDFRNLLLGARQSRPTVEAALGLVGELLVLNELLQRKRSAWRSWTGPTGARHDFRAGDFAIEAKTALRAQKRTIEISALDQLAEPDGGILLLAHHVLEHDSGGPITVADQAERALKAADDRDGLASMLAQAGYVPELRERWASFRFSIRETGYYKVDHRFPRLVPGMFRDNDLPVGVSHVRYRVDLDLADDCRITGSELANILEGIVA